MVVCEYDAIFILQELNSPVKFSCRTKIITIKLNWSRLIINKYLLSNIFLKFYTIWVHKNKYSYAKWDRLLFHLGNYNKTGDHKREQFKPGKKSPEDRTSADGIPGHTMKRGQTWAEVPYEKWTEGHTGVQNESRPVVPQYRINAKECEHQEHNR